MILDEPGAERLLRNGDMLLMLEGKLTRLQGVTSIRWRLSHSAEAIGLTSVFMVCPVDIHAGSAREVRQWLIR